MGDGWTLQQIADTAGVAKQSLSQYCMLPGSKGARIIPAAALDRLRAAVTHSEAERRDRGFPAFLARETYLWHVHGPDLFETTSPWRAEWHAARTGGIAMPGQHNTSHRDSRLSDDEELCLRWLGARFTLRTIQERAGKVDGSDEQRIAGVDEYLIERVGHEHKPWCIQPTLAQVRELEELALGEIYHAA